jgi:N6-adenosine-specific RNA methylase IME4
MELHPLCHLFPPMSQEQFAGLVENIRGSFQREPIVVFEGKILDGRHRYRACVEIGIEPKFSTFEGTPQDAIEYIIATNMTRRHLDESQRAMVAAKLANMKSGRQAKTGPNGPLVSNSQAADRLNVGRSSVTRAKRVLSGGSEELIKAVEGGEIPVSVGFKIAEMSHDLQREIVADPRPDQAIKKAARKDRERELADKTITASLAANTKLYNVIYADPPWHFEVYSEETGMDRSADNHYPTMSIDEIKELTVPAADDAVLYLWATVPMLPEALAVMSAWGFTYKSHIAWVKDKIGTGYWTRNKHELLLIGTRGKIPAPMMGTQPPSAMAVDLLAHSEKPPIFAMMIEHLFPTVPKLEMFCRSARPGWDVMGNEADNGTA